MSERSIKHLESIDEIEIEWILEKMRKESKVDVVDDDIETSERIDDDGKVEHRAWFPRWNDQNRSISPLSRLKLLPLSHKLWELAVELRDIVLACQPPLSLPSVDDTADHVRLPVAMMHYKARHHRQIQPKHRCFYWIKLELIKSSLFY